MMSRTANRRRFGHDSEEIGREAADAGLVEHGGERLGLLLGGEHRAAHQARQIRAFGDQRVEALEIGLARRRRLRFERELEQRGRVTPRHAGNDRSSPATSRTLGVLLPRCRSLACSASSALARGSAQALGIQAGLGLLGEAAECPERSAEIEGALANTRRYAAQQRQNARLVALLALQPSSLVPAKAGTDICSP